MSAEQIVIVGAGPGGLATARAYRERGGRGRVTLLGEERLLPYQRPPLTKEFLRGEIDEAELPIEQQPWFERHEVDLRAGVRVAAIEPPEACVKLEDGERLRADAIVLATGSEPVRPDLPGLDHPSVLTMRTLPDSLALSGRTREGRSMTVIGTGFIGCEIAGSLAIRGASVTLIGREPVPQGTRLGEDVGRRIADWLRRLGVRLIGDAAVCAVHDARVVELADGRRIAGSCVVLGMGVRPRGELAHAAGLSLRDGAVLVDEGMRSSTERGLILAVGDVARALNVSAGRHLRVEHWGDALGHGEVAGATLAGARGRWQEVPGFWSTIGEQTLKYAAWGDGYDDSRLLSHADGGFTAWYSRDGAAVGVLTHDRDQDYERGRELIRKGEPAP